ncbi:metal ABC transporter solute-binding protein, Zn/Mn family [Demequina sp. NBRC 110053]|uniref:metal ABC transporter solute-binding protein, Zn/Mn family n=1 Tax=Demequina sp. NBRC 110053 TaxID=1570342 RepID=UPI001185508F|nr:zinc ABC transporter substrate-binding protein [Demequina sp. NBRC 110053]
MNPRPRPAAQLAAAIAASLAAAGCASPESEDAHATMSVYATTGYLADAVAAIAPEAEVITMVGPGGDPHTYQPSTKDVQAIQSADVVLWNGLHLEAQVSDQLSSLGDRQLAVAELLPEDLLLPWPETDEDGKPLHDPHVWNSPEAWSLVVGYVADKLGETDPERADAYAANAADFQEEIAAAAAEAAALLASIPEPRILITGHDAFAYFGDTYDLDVHATDFVSTEAALSAGELSDLARLIADHEVPVIFQDNQANPQAITSLSEAVTALGWDVRVSGEELYADSLGADEGVDTYLGVFRHNAEAIAKALGTEAAP